MKIEMEENITTNSHSRDSKKNHNRGKKKEKGCQGKWHETE